MAYSVDFRKKILEVYLAKENTNEEIANRFKVSTSTVKRIGQRFRETGKVGLYLTNIGHACKIDSQAKEMIKTMVSKKPSATLEEICLGLKEQRNIAVTPQAVHYILKDLLITYKKKSFYAVERDREDVKKKEKSSLRK
jgi:transposase